MAKDQLSAAAAAIQSLDGSAFVTLHSRLDRGGALQARKLANGAVQCPRRSKSEPPCRL